MERRPHLLIMPCPAQGHVAPLMKLAHLISGHDIKVTFLTSEFIHAKLLASQPHQSEVGSRIELASVPDWLGPRNDRNDIAKALENSKRLMPGYLKDFIQKVNGTSNEDEQITCVIADIFYGSWPIEVANGMGIQGIPFCAFGPGTLALVLHIPKLIQARILSGTDGSLLSDELVFVSTDIPVLRGDRLPWSWPNDVMVQEAIFGVYLTFNQIIHNSEWLLLNCAYELDTAACDFVPNILPIGPLLASNHPGHPSGSFWPEDSTCISWLDDQPPGSVIYVAFGSSTIFDQHQFNELAFALELVDQPFLWVVRSDFTNESAVQCPDGFIERVTAGHGKIVSWAPQERVLAHPSVACFLSHCGWNSTMDGIVLGVPFLCWPYHTDQFYNENTICDKWKVGLRLNPDENGFVSRHEIKRKVEELISDHGIKENVSRLKEIAKKSGSEGGSSYNNLKTFIEALKQ